MGWWNLNLRDLHIDRFRPHGTFAVILNYEWRTENTQRDEDQFQHHLGLGDWRTQNWLLELPEHPGHVAVRAAIGWQYITHPNNITCEAKGALWAFARAIDNWRPE